MLGFQEGGDYDFILDIDAIGYPIFIIGLCIAITSILGMFSAGCAKCAKTPDGKCDGCEKCCTGFLALLFIIIMTALLLGSIVIAGVLSYFYSLVGDSNSCPYPSGSDQVFAPSGGEEDTNVPDILACPLDHYMYTEIYQNTSTMWKDFQDFTVTCGYDCDSASRTENSEVYYCAPDYADGIYGLQTTGTFCVNGSIFDIETQPFPTVYTGTNLDGVANVFPSVGEVTTMPLRPTIIQNMETLILPFLIVWWCIVVLALLLIISSCVMCCRKKNTNKQSAKYKPGQYPTDSRT